jgi:hypothetical protein
MRQHLAVGAFGRVVVLLEMLELGQTQEQLLGLRLGLQRFVQPRLDLIDLGGLGLSVAQDGHTRIDQRGQRHLLAIGLEDGDSLVGAPVQAGEVGESRGRVDGAAGALLVQLGRALGEAVLLGRDHAQAQPGELFVQLADLLPLGHQPG